MSALSRALKWMWKQLEQGAVESNPEALAAVIQNERRDHAPTER